MLENLSVLSRKLTISIEVHEVVEILNYAVGAKLIWCGASTKPRVVVACRKLKE
jgi:hypothetical protein